MLCCFDKIDRSGFSQTRVLRHPTKSREGFTPERPTMILLLKASQVSEISMIFVVLVCVSFHVHMVLRLINLKKDGTLCNHFFRLVVLSKVMSFSICFILAILVIILKRIFNVVSVEQILTHWYAETLLWVRYQFSQTEQCIAKGKQLTLLINACLLFFR